jgi:ABC-2 type transport system ATP-binding protein
MSEELARCRAVSHRFGTTVAVADVDLDVNPGEVVGLLGANGAGKTTLIRIMLGLLRPSAGTVRLFGEPPSRRTRGRIGYVPQAAGIYDDLTAEENLAFTRAAFGAGDMSLPEALRVPAGIPAGRLGLGLQRRLAFAVAYCHRPGLFVLDEPTSGVNALTRSRLWDVIRQAADSGAGVLVTTHSMEEAQECDRLVMMAAGRRVADGTVSAIVGAARVTTVDCADWATALRALADTGLRAALVGRSLRVPGATPGRVRDALAGLPAQVGEAPASLEERFVELTADAQGESEELS